MEYTLRRDNMAKNDPMTLRDWLKGTGYLTLAILAFVAMMVGLAGCVGDIHKTRHGDTQEYLGYDNATLPAEETNHNITSAISRLAASNLTDSYYPTLEDAGAPADENDTLTVMTFNLEVFGPTESSDEERLSTIADIVSTADLIAVQEIRDASGEAIKRLDEELNKRGDYDYAIGPRLGRTRSKEQYAFIYDPTEVKVLDTYTYDDSQFDLFHREPFAAHVSSIHGDFDAVILNMHTDPDEATQEIPDLTKAIRDAREHFNEPDVILAGDLNADCRYYDEDLRNPLRTNYRWLVPNSADTNTADSDCTYDRIIITESMKESLPKNATQHYHIITHPSVETVSDHYPVTTRFTLTDSD